MQQLLLFRITMILLFGQQVRMVTSWTGSSRYIFAMARSSRTGKAFASTLHRQQQQLKQRQAAFHPHRRSFAASSGDGTSSEITELDTRIGNQLSISVEDAVALLQEHPNQIAFVDGTWWMPNMPQTKGRAGFLQGPRIPGALFWDIDDIANDLSGLSLPHMIPLDPRVWPHWANFYKLTPQHHIIVYGQHKDCHFVHRTWYQIGAMGHPWARVHLLDGSLEEWSNTEGGQVDDNVLEESAVLTYQQVVDAMDKDEKEGTTLTSYPLLSATGTNGVVDRDFVQTVCTSSSSSSVQIVDARTADRFYGEVDEPRPGLERGHHPGAINLFFGNLVQPEAKARLQPVSDLQTKLQAAGLVLEKDDGDDGSTPDLRVITSCGSGVTACTILAALVAVYGPASFSQIALYDGSWAEWGADPSLPKEK